MYMYKSYDSIHGMTYITNIEKYFIWVIIVEHDLKWLLFVFKLLTLISEYI